MIALLLALLSLAPVPAADDGPCPSPQPAIVPGDDYAAGVWTHADGRVFGLAAYEDQCILGVTVVTP